ncbi:MAG TPA: M50 family metallopeptidase [Acidimicrobiales bacterium]
MRFPLFGFPVRIHGSFLLTALVLGLIGPEPNLGRAVVWIAVVLVSVLVHELGHAFAARAAGAEPTIDLYALGGLTAFAPSRPLSRLQAIGISLAGPFAGFLLGVLVLSAAAALGVERPSPYVGVDEPLVNVLVGASIWVNLYWGAVNLLPILPLDGGNVIRSMLPGDDETRDRIAAGVSLAVATAIVIALLRNDLGELILLPLMLGVFNLHTLVNLNRGDTRVTENVMATLQRLDRDEPDAMRDVVAAAAQAPPALRDRLKVTAVEILARKRRVREARDALARLPGNAHPALYALVDVVDGDPHGITMLDEMVRAQPVPSVARYVLLARLLAGRSRDIPSVYLSLPPSAQAAEHLRELQYLAHVGGDFVSAATIGELQLGLGAAADPWVLYNTACSWSRAGDRERALLRLSQAIDAGWSDADQLDTDQDLAPLWVSERFRELRRRLTPA